MLFECVDVVVHGARLTLDAVARIAVESNSSAAKAMRGGHDIPAVARNLRYRAPTKREDGKVKSSLQNRRSEGQNMHRKRHGDVKSPLQMHAAWIGASLPHLFPASDIPSGRSSARMRTD